MAIDLGLSTGGQRTSRGARSTAARVDTGEVTTRSVDFAQSPLVRTDAGGPDVGASVSSALSKFFSGQIERQTEEDIRKIKRENADEIARLEVAVRSDREGAREAILTGDYSKFIPNDELRRRRVIHDSFQSFVAQQMAYEDFEKQLRGEINATPLNGDPDAVVAGFIKRQTLGADPAFARDYARTIAKNAGTAVTEFREKRLELQQSEAERRSVEIIRSEVSAKHLPPTVEGLTSLRNRIIGSLPMNAPEAVARADALIDTTLITMAAGGNALALKMASLPDPDRDGTSVLSRNPGAMEKAVASHIKHKTSVRSIEASSELESFEDRLALIEAGVPAEGDSVQDLWADLWNHRSRHGDSGAWDSMRDKVASAIKTKGVEIGSARLIAHGRIPTMSNAEWSKYAEKIWNGEVRGALISEGLSEQAAAVREIQVLARRGSGAQLKDHNSAVILGSADEAEVESTYIKLKSLAGASSRPLKGLHLSEDASSLFRTMAWAEKSGRNPFAVRQSYLEALSAADGEGTPDRHFEFRLVNPGARESKTYGRAGVSRQAKLMWDDLEVPELMVPGFLGDTMPSYSDLSPAARSRLEQAVNTASFMLSRQNAGLSEIRSLAAEMVKGEFGLEMDADGNTSVTIDMTPPVSSDADGSPVPGQRVTTEVLDRAKTALQDAGASAVITAIGGATSLRQDSLTRAGHGLAVRPVVNGFEQDVLLIPGRTHMIPLSDLPPDMPQVFFEEVRRDEKSDQLFIKVPNPRREDGSMVSRVHLTDNLFMLYDNERGGWTLRYADTGAPKKSLRELADENRQNRRAAVPGGSRETSRRRATLDALEESLRAREAPVGSPVPGPTDGGPVTPEEEEATQEVEESALDTLQARGVVSPSSRLAEIGEFLGGIFGAKEAKASDLAMRTENVRMKEKSRGGWLDDLTKPQNRRFLREVSNLIDDYEGRVPYVYDDHTGRAPSGKFKGDPTIGIGFNLNRPDARELITKVGADYDKVLKGEQLLTDGQINTLFGFAVKETANWLRKHFDGVNLENHRWMALISLAYNSRWNERGPTLIGPDLTKAIREGRWEDAAIEIERDSLGGVPKSLLPGIKARRKQEADLFRGTLS